MIQKLLLFIFIFHQLVVGGQCRDLKMKRQAFENAGTKLAVALGNHNDKKLDSIEVIDLSSTETTCEPLPNFIQPTERAAGTIVNGGKPLICGGTNSRVCYTLEDGIWRSASSFQTDRSNFAMTKSPFPSDGSSLFVTGGSSSNQFALKTTEVLTENGWEHSVPLPEPTAMHCMVSITPTRLMLIGGSQDKNGKTSATSETFFFNGKLKRWTSGPQLLQPRYLHACAIIKTDSTSQRRSIIVVGGWANGKHRSTEIFDLGSSKWRPGPELPTISFRPAIVEDPAGGVLLIGGDSIEKHLDTIFRLPHSRSTWTELPQKLQTSRVGHTAFFIPDSLPKCSSSSDYQYDY